MDKSDIEIYEKIKNEYGKVAGEILKILNKHKAYSDKTEKKDKGEE